MNCLLASFSVVKDHYTVDNLAVGMSPSIMARSMLKSIISKNAWKDGSQINSNQLCTKSATSLSCTSMII